MTIFLNLYIIVYLVTLIKINYLITNYLLNISNEYSLNYTIIYILKFSKFKNLIFILFLSLAGLPPFFMFFIKFNYLINILYKTNIFIFFFIFIIFFLNMIFYIQIFFNKNNNLPLILPKGKKAHINFNIIYLIIFFLSLNFLSIFIFTDFYYIFKLVINGNI